MDFPNDANHEISGVLFKRRGGFAKIMPNAWVSRFFVVKEGFLYYFDTETPPDGHTVDIAKARGKIDLARTVFEFYAESAIEGAPTTFGMQICPLNEEKWKLCSVSREDMRRWSDVFEKYAKINKSVPSSPRETTLYHSDDEKGQMERHMLQSSQSLRVPTLRPLPTQTLSSSTTTMPKVQLATRLSTKRGIKTSKSSSSLVSTEFMEWLSTLAVMNICFYLAGSIQFTIPCLFFIALANFIVAQTLSLRLARLRHATDACSDVAQNSGIVKSLHNDTGSEVAGHTKSFLEEISASKSAAHVAVIGGKPPAGCTFRQVESSGPRASSPEHSWQHCDHRSFALRIGPDYARNKKKAPSPPPLYEPFAMDVFCSKHRVDHASQRFAIPPEYLSLNTNHPAVPAVFVVQIQIPSDPPPNLFATVEDGPGWAILIYFRITEYTCTQLKDLTRASGAVKLLADYCSMAPSDPAYKTRFKVICACSNLDELGVPYAISSYNAKPVLIRRTGALFVDDNVMEKDINVYKFANIAKQSIHFLSSRIGLMYTQMGFVIEGRTDAELPETLIGCVAINKPQEDQAEFLFDDLAL